eukprot:ctg_487.g127
MVATTTNGMAESGTGIPGGEEPACGLCGRAGDQPCGEGRLLRAIQRRVRGGGATGVYALGGGGAARALHPVQCVQAAGRDHYVCARPSAAVLDVLSFSVCGVVGSGCCARRCSGVLCGAPGAACGGGRALGDAAAVSPSAAGGGAGAMSRLPTQGHDAASGALRAL